MARVIVAEDDRELRHVVAGTLRAAGHAVTVARDGAALLARIAVVFDRDPSLSLIDVIVSDVRMPTFGGLEVLERLAAARWRVPFILMTAFGDEETRRRAERAGAVFLDKPLALDALCEMVTMLATYPVEWRSVP